jgi:ferredoxin
LAAPARQASTSDGNQDHGRVHQLRRTSRGPNSAITQGDDIYVIDPNLCTECVGFHGQEACQAVCPVDCCIPDEEKGETEEQLYARLATVHPDKQFPPLAELTAELSRFRK